MSPMRLMQGPPGPASGEFVCANEMPPSAVTSFVWGSRVDRAASKPQPSPTEVPVPSKPKKPRRRQSARTIDQDAAKLRDALDAEKAADLARDPATSDAERSRLIQRTEASAARLQKAVVDVHSDFDDDGCEAVGLETENHYILAIPSYAIQLIGESGFAIAIPKANIIKLTESKAK